MAVDWNSPAMLARIGGALNRGVAVAIHEVENEAVRLITQEPKTGKVYTTRFATFGSGPTRKVVPYGLRPPHQASAPGEAPASDTGRLVNSRDVALIPADYRATLTFRTNYAHYLEYGTDRMEARPYARAAVANKRGEIVAAIRAEIGAELK